MCHFAADHAGKVRGKLATPSFLNNGAGLSSTCQLFVGTDKIRNPVFYPAELRAQLLLHQNFLAEPPVFSTQSSRLG
jgi:hypothetical protein